MAAILAYAIFVKHTTWLPLLGHKLLKLSVIQTVCEVLLHATA